MAARGQRLRATLVLVGDGEAPAGTLLGDDGVERRFAGWMELADAIEAWRAGPQVPPGEPRAPEESPR